MKGLLWNELYSSAKFSNSEYCLCTLQLKECLLSECKMYINLCKVLMHIAKFQTFYLAKLFRKVMDLIK